VSSVLLSTAAGFLLSVFQPFRRYHYPIINSNCYTSYDFKFNSNYHSDFYDPICDRGHHSSEIFAPSLGVCCYTLQDHTTRCRNFGNNQPVTERRTKTSSSQSADESWGMEGDPVQITGGRQSRRVPGARLFCMFCLSRLYHYLSIVKINPFRPSPSHSATESQSSDIVYRFLVGPPLLGDRTKFFRRGPNPLSVALSAPLRTPENSHYM
jgi:hypothetical protein